MFLRPSSGEIGAYTALQYSFICIYLALEYIHSSILEGWGSNFVRGCRFTKQGNAFCSSFSHSLSTRLLSVRIRPLSRLEGLVNED
jgi:hypothetical protein